MKKHSESTANIAPFDSSFIRELPIVGELLALKDSVRSIQDMLFLNKIQSFLTPLEDIPEEKLLEQITRIENDPKYKTKVGEKILHIIEAAEDAEKAEICGHIFQKFIAGDIEYNLFLRATTMVRNISANDLYDFAQNESEYVDGANYRYSLKKNQKNIWDNYFLVTSGLLFTYNESISLRGSADLDDDGTDLANAEVTIEITEVGELIKECLSSH